MFEVPVTVGTNVLLSPPISATLPGDKLTLTVCCEEAGCNVTATVALWVGSATLVAVTRTNCCDGMEAGAV